MAVMASPQPEAAPISLKATDPSLDKENKPGMNGHPSPSADTAPEPEPAALVNGNGKHGDDASPTNGHPEKTSLDAQNRDAVESNRTLSSKEPVETSDSAKPTAPTETEDIPNSSETPAGDDDVDTGDAANGEKTSDTSPAPASRPTASNEAPATPSETSNAAAADVVMGDDAASAPSPVPEKVNGADEKSPEKDAEKASEDSVVVAPLPAATEESPALPTDTPSEPPVKVAREREEDAADEPAPKRARTEDTTGDAVSEQPAATQDEPEPEPMQDVVEVPRAESKGPSDLDTLAGWADPEAKNKPITLYQSREYRRVLAGVKKTKNGGHFKDSVQKLWPMLANSYILKVDTPMDIGELERNLREGNEYQTLADFKKHLGLLYLNSLSFNGPANDITVAGWNVVDLIWSKIKDIPPEEPPKPKAQPKQMPSRHAEPRVAAPPPAPPSRRQSVAATAASPTSKAPETESYAVPPSGVPQIRRTSTQNEGDRPKRAIHPPKNRDPDYTSKTINPKKLPVDLQFAHAVLTEIMDAKHIGTNGPFMSPVDPIALQIPTYHTVIKHPMDLGTIHNKMASGEYQNAKAFVNDVNLVFKNCFKFNQPGQPVYLQGKDLETLFKSEWAKKDQWIAKNSTPKATSADPSNASEDESEEEEDGDAGGAEEGPTTSALTQKLEERLQKETEIVTQLYLAADPSNDALISLQQTILSAIRERLVAEKNRLQALKPEKPAKAKAAKPSKPKAGGAGGAKKSGAAGGGGRKSTGAAPKKATKRQMSPHEKDLIANAINDLESPHIERAIDIIKKDTGQAENSSGELELEIEQISNDALHKLWDLCKKALPNFGKQAHSNPDSDPVNSGPASKQASAKSKPKKNKPMNAAEQEARIAELEHLRHLYDAKNPGGAASPDEDGARGGQDHEQSQYPEDESESDSEEE